MAQLGALLQEQAVFELPKAAREGSKERGAPQDDKALYRRSIVVLRKDHEVPRKAFVHCVRDRHGPTAPPAEVTFVEGLPKTRSGKMRRLLKAQALGRDPSDTSTLD